MCCCLEVIVKFVLFAVNTITGLASIALITLGAILISYINQIDQLDIPSIVSGIPIMIIVSGVIIFIVSFSGCCGAISEIQCLLIMYTIFMLIFAGLKTYVAVFIFQALSTIHETITTWVNRMFDAHQGDGAFLALERLIRCCGTTGEDSYANMGFIPGTCCANPIPVDAPIAGGSVCQPGTTYDGCATILADTVRNFGLPLGSFVIGVVIVELAAMVFAIFLIIRISSKRSSDSRKQYY